MLEKQQTNTINLGTNEEYILYLLKLLNLKHSCSYVSDLNFRLHYLTRRRHLRL